MDVRSRNQSLSLSYARMANSIVVAVRDTLPSGSSDKILREDKAEHGNGIR